ncbi:hypothetical protein LX32DRAFT_301938 [Colletotrichum zoysiae]|uniref:Uncharacterized protein n=1 Tax=Colletotrichum zoysiae TaxID=1216348 RepID=A0AAD9HMS0_9PEZI|nr:hypothetical protein LX32DRAFT_301938 [Colletotrichum zoysiae]
MMRKGGIACLLTNGWSASSCLPSSSFPLLRRLYSLILQHGETNVFHGIMSQVRHVHDVSPTSVAAMRHRHVLQLSPLQGTPPCPRRHRMAACIAAPARPGSAGRQTVQITQLASKAHKQSGRSITSGRNRLWEWLRSSHSQRSPLYETLGW